MSNNLRRRTTGALLWSLVQSWGGRALGLLIFVVLARLVTPTEFGLVAAAFLVLTLITIVAELGVGDAMVQRATLPPEAISLPFYASLSASIIISAAVIISARTIAIWMENSALTPVIVAVALIAPIHGLASFQEALFRREMLFRKLAFRTLGGIILGGAVGIGLALAGFGVWSLVAQYATQVVVNACFLWVYRLWTPSGQGDITSFREIMVFGGSILMHRLLDFAAVRCIELIILGKHGPTALGLFAVASRLSQTLSQLLQAGLWNVALSALSRIATDRERMARLFQHAFVLATLIGAPLFLAFSALSPEISSLLFGSRWDGVANIMQLLFALGAAQFVQSFSNAFLAAIGRPQRLMQVNAITVASLAALLSWIETQDVYQTTRLYAGVVALLSLLSLASILSDLPIRLHTILRALGSGLAASALAFAAVTYMRSAGAAPSDLWIRSVVLGAVFTSTYAMIVILLAWRPLKLSLEFLKPSLRS